MRWLMNLTRKANQPRQPGRTKRRVRPRVEVLEDRLAPAIIFGAPANGEFLQGFAFADPSDQFHSGEGLAGATIALYGAPVVILGASTKTVGPLVVPTGTVLLATTTSDASGYYRFDNTNVPGGLTPGTYYVTETAAPPGYAPDGTQVFSQLDPTVASVTLGGQNFIKTTIVDPSQLMATLDSDGFYNIDSPTFFGTPLPGITGQLDIHLTDSAAPSYRSPPSGSFISYCVDLVDTVNLGDTFPVLPTPATTGLPNGPEIAYLYNEYGTTGALKASNAPFGAPTDDNQAEALQEAIWQLEYGANFTPDFHGSTEVQQAYNFYLSDAAGKNEAAVVLDATLGGTLATPLPHGQSVLASESLNFNNVPQAHPTVTTTPTPTLTYVGGPILQDSATLTGGNNPTGTITFTLFGPDGVTIVDTETVPVSGNGIYATPTGYVPTSAGIDNWVATYSGDVNNLLYVSPYGAEAVTVLLGPGQISKRLFLTSTNGAAPVAAAGPVLITPSGPITAMLPLFAWTPANGAAHYDIWIDDLTSGQDPLIRNQNVATTTFTPAAPLTLGHSYEWWVRAVTAAGTAGPWSAAVNFNVALAAPALVGPLGSIPNATPGFTWNAVANADYYDIWVNDVTASQGQVLRNIHVTATSWTPGSTLVPGHQYEWWVRALSNSGAASSWGAGSYFTVALLAAPVPAGPVGAIANVTPTFSWSAAAGADYYDLWVNDQTTGQIEVIRLMHVVGTSVSAPVALAAGNSYEWWVRAVSNNGDDSNWSSALTFSL